MPESKSIENMIKAGLLKKGSDPSLVVNRLPTGIGVLDDLLGGGLPLGRFIESYGPESTGKTLLSQYAVAAVQKSQYPIGLYMDMEHSFDEAWWKQIGVDTDKLLVSNPVSAEQAIDVMRAMLETSKELGIIILDSIAAMTPMPEVDPEKSSENKTIGLQARVTTLMYRQIAPLLDNRVIFMATNQMRESIGYNDELSALPGGRAQRHFNHIILRTRREDWILETGSKKRIGFYMEVISKKNKLAGIADGSSVTLPFMFSGQIDYTATFIDEAIKKDLIIRRGPYYEYNGHRSLGMALLRQYFTDNPDELESLKRDIENVPE